MSNQRPPRVALFVTLVCFAHPAFAQSRELLEAVRVHRPTARATAEAEYSACAGDQASKPPPRPCPEASRLSLLLGFLELSDGDAAQALTQLKLRPAPRGLESVYLWYLGEAQAWSGQKAAALKSFERASKGAPAWLKKRLQARQAELWVATKKYDKAIPFFDGLDVDTTPELLFARGRPATRAAIAKAGWPT